MVKRLTLPAKVKHHNTPSEGISKTGLVARRGHTTGRSYHGKVIPQEGHPTGRSYNRKVTPQEDHTTGKPYHRKEKTP
jgi:hypothetical protein